MGNGVGGGDNLHHDEGNHHGAVTRGTRTPDEGAHDIYLMLCVRVLHTGGGVVGIDVIDVQYIE